MDAQIMAKVNSGCAARSTSCRRYHRRASRAEGVHSEWGTPFIATPLRCRPLRRQKQRAVRAEEAQQAPVAADDSGYKELMSETHKRLQQLREARIKNEARLKKGYQPGGDKKAADQPQIEAARKLVSTSKAVDRRVYDQVAASRNRLSQQLSAKNKYIRHLEGMLEERMQTVALAHAAVLRITSELDSIKRLAEVAVAASAFGVDKDDAVTRGKRIAKRAETLKQGIVEETKALDRLMVRRVPIMWYGVATEVKFMGSFDNWTEGFSLSPEEIQDQTFTRFRADVPLLPGSYKVKFQVDDKHWRLAPDWPTVEEPDGSSNNLLVVE